MESIPSVQSYRKKRDNEVVVVVVVVMKCQPCSCNESKAAHI